MPNRKEDYPSEDEEYTYVRDIEPDRSMSDYYCKLCDAHMNNEDMWDSHLKGKRHLKNARKEPDEQRAKVKAVKKTGEKPMIYSKLEETTSPLIGLQYLCELQRSSKLSNCMYTCYLCHAVSDHNLVIEHITSLKHRLNYIKLVDIDGYNLLHCLKLKKNDQEAIVEDKARDVETKEGRGIMEVKVEKTSHDTSSTKRYSDHDGDGMLPNPAKKAHRDFSARSEGPLVPTNPQDIKFLNIDTKLLMLRELALCPITSEVEARVAAETVNMLMPTLLACKRRFMSSEMGPNFGPENMSTNRFQSNENMVQYPLPYPGPPRDPFPRDHPLWKHY